MKNKVTSLLIPIVFILLSWSFLTAELTYSSLFEEVSPADRNSVDTNFTGNLIFEETFEGTKPFSTAYDSKDHLGFWNYAMQYVTEPVLQGTKSVRFEIRKDQPLIKKGKRAEVVIVKGNIYRNTWYSFSAFFPAEGYEYDNEREVICQWYQNGTPATSIRTQRDRLLLETGNKIGQLKKFDLGPITKNRWHEFVLHFIHSSGSDGLIEVWHNGMKLLDVHGGNMYNMALPKWKIGLYKAAFKTESSLVKKRIIYYDNVRVGSSKAGFSDMTSRDRQDN